MHHPDLDFTAATALSKDLRAALHELGATTLGLVTRQDDPEDGTTKLLLRARDGSLLETVIMRYRQRSTVCVSSQVGCALGCVFCSTGGLGFRRNLTTAEIVDQVRSAQAVLHGRGPARRPRGLHGHGRTAAQPRRGARLDRPAARPRRSGHGPALVVGLDGRHPGRHPPPGDEAPQVNLALSLHAPDDALRSRLMPVGRKYGLHEVMKAVEDHFDRTHRKLFVEYLLLAGVNDGARQAHALADLVRGRVATVNLIPWNPGFGDFAASPPETVDAFRAILFSRGIETTVRERRGQSIAAACGQLAAGPGAQGPQEGRQRGQVGAPRGRRPPAGAAAKRPAKRADPTPGEPASDGRKRQDDPEGESAPRLRSRAAAVRPAGRSRD